MKAAMDNYEFDIEILISMVEQRPVLWDKTLDRYKNKNLTTIAWKEICFELNENYPLMSEEEKELFCKVVIKKWTNVKDSWVKVLRKNMERKSLGKRSKKYIYEDLVSFLNKVYNPIKEPEVILKVEGDDIPQDYEDLAQTYEDLALSYEAIPQLDSTDAEKNLPEIEKKPFGSCSPGRPTTTVASEGQSLVMYSKGRKKRRTDDAEINVSSSVLVSNSMPDFSEDRHFSFFKSILPSIQQFDEEEIIQFQMGVLNVVRSIRHARSIVQSNLS